MPKETFFNRPLVKRDKLIEASVNEFARKSCAEASINRIIQTAVIPRGSFYQYFSGKMDLFQYVLRRYKEQMGVLCGKLTPEEGRKQLIIKTTLIRRGAEESGSRI